MSNLPATDRRLTEIKEHQEKDPTLQKWKKEIQQGRRKKKCMSVRHLHEQCILEPGDEVWIFDQGISGEVDNEQGPR